jgi:hypothetical protein
MIHLTIGHGQAQGPSGKLGPNRDPRASCVSTLFMNTVIVGICACFAVLETG